MELTKFYNFQDHCSRNWTNTVWLLSCRSSLRNFTRGTFTRFSLVKHSAGQRFKPVKLNSKRHLTLFCTEKPSVMLHEQNFSVKVYDSLFWAVPITPFGQWPIRFSYFWVTLHNYDKIDFLTRQKRKNPKQNWSKKFSSSSYFSNLRMFQVREK